MAIKGRANINLTSITDAIVQGTEPEKPTDGMLWLDNSQTPNVLKRYNQTSGQWEIQTISVADADPNVKDQIDQANTAAQNALTSANGKNKNYYGIMEPVDPQEGDRWFKSVNGEEVQTFIYSSGKWEPITLAPENLGTIYAEDGVLGSVDAGVITVGMLSANRIGVGDFTNLLPNPNFSNNLDRWEVNSTNTAYTAKAIATNNGYGIELAKTGSDLTQVSVWTNEYIPVNPGDKFYVSYFINQTAGISFNGINNMGVYAFRYKSDLTNMSGEGMLLTRNPNAGFLEGIYTVPADVYFLKIQPYHGTSGTNAATANTAISLTNIVIRKVMKGTMIEDGTITTDKLNVTSLSAISSDFGSMTAGSIDLGSGNFKVDTKGNATIKGGTIRQDYSVTAIGGTPAVIATGTTKIQNGAFLASDSFTQGGSKYTRDIELNGNGLNIAVRQGNNPAASVSIDPMAGIYLDGANHKIQLGNLMLNNAHSLGMVDGDTLYFNQGYGGSDRIDIACKSVKTSSLYSLKENLTAISPEKALSEIIRTDVVQYNFKGDDTSETHTSLIIDDRPEDEKEFYACPEFVTSDGESRDDGNIVGYLMLAVKKLKQEIDELQAS